MPLRLVNRAALPPAHLSVLEAEVPEQQTLADVVRWLASLEPHALISDVIVMDEYTHDVVVPWKDGLVLVYDTT